MRSINELTLVGLVGKVNTFEKATKVSIATERSWKDEDGEWVNVTDWVDVTILHEKRRKWVSENVGPGDMVLCKARVSNGSYEKEGVKIYTVEIVSERFEVLTPKAEREDGGE